MKALADALAEQGEPFPFPFGLPCNIYPGFVVKLLAAPRVGKSLAALNWAIDIAERDMPVLIHSMDTDYGTQAQRAAAILSGETLDTIAEDKSYWAGWLRGSELPLRFSTAPVTDANFGELVLAEAEYWGESPAMVIVDVAQNLLRGEENVGNVKRIYRSLQGIARRTNAVVVALDHVVAGDAAGGSMFVRMEDGLYEKGQIPEIVLTLWRSGQTQLTMFLAKNRAGPDGQKINLHVDPSRAVIRV